MACLGPLLAVSLALGEDFPVARSVALSGLFLLAVVAVVALGTRHSTGIPFGHDRGGELLAGIALAATVAVPYAVITGRVTAAALVESAIFGLWLVQALICANADGTRGGARNGRAFVAGVFLLNWATVITAIATGVVSPWAGMLLQPLWMLEGYAFYKVMRGAWRARRGLGSVAVCLGVAGLAIGNVLG